LGLKIFPKFHKTAKICRMGCSNSQFGRSSTGEEVSEKINLTNKYVIVTGANTGLGFETARVLALRGANVILACRTLEKGKEAISKIQQQIPNANVESMELNLSSFKSVDKFSKEYIEKNYPLHILICNAGVFGVPYGLSEDGIELVLSVHLGHFLLCNLLLDVLRNSSPSRVVVVSSNGHKVGNINLNQFPIPENLYSSFSAYSQAKLCDVLFASEFHRRFSSEGIEAFSLHPGDMIATDISRHSKISQFFFSSISWFTKTIPQGAATTIYCSVTPNIKGGLYYENCCQGQPSVLSQDSLLASQLWEWSAKTVNLSSQ